MPVHGGNGEAGPSPAAKAVHGALEVELFQIRQGAVPGKGIEDFPEGAHHAGVQLGSGRLLAEEALLLNGYMNMAE